MMIALLGTASVFAEPDEGMVSDTVSVSSVSPESSSTVTSQASSEEESNTELSSDSTLSDTALDSDFETSSDFVIESTVSEVISKPTEASKVGTATSQQTSSKKSNQQTQSISSEWNSNLNNILNNACDWLKNKEEGDMYFVALGGAGKSAGTQEYVMFMNDIAKNTTYTQLYPLAINTLNATFCGVNASNAQGMNLINMISDFSGAENSQTRALAYALLALDSNTYTVPEKSVLTREALCRYLMQRQQENGSFSITEEESTLESTALALAALSNYRGDEETLTVLKKGVEYLQNMQYGNRRQSAFLKESGDTVSQIIIALNALKINVNDTRFIVNKKGLDEILLTFLGSDGGFKKYASDSQSDLETTELAIIALTAIKYGSNPYLLKQQVPDSVSSEVLLSAPSSRDFRWLFILLGILLIASAGVAFLIYRRNAGKRSSVEKKV